MPQGHGWRVRCFSPGREVPFCGHATIALGAALARQVGPGTFPLMLNDAEITVEGRRAGDLFAAALQSPPTRSAAVPAARLDAALDLFGLGAADLDARIPPALVHAGADHLVLMLESRARLAATAYDFDLQWPHSGAIDVLQGDDMGMPSRVRAEIPAAPGASIRVSGHRPVPLIATGQRKPLPTPIGTRCRLAFG